MKWWDGMPASSFFECRILNQLFHSVSLSSRGSWFIFTFCHEGGVIWISEAIDISPSNVDSSLCFIQPRVSHDLGYLTWKSRPSLLLSLVNSVSFLFLLWVPPSTCISTSIPDMVISNFNHHCDRLGIWWYYDMGSSLVVLVVNNLPANAED